MNLSIRLARDKTLEFKGIRLARVVALNHDNSIRRQFCVYSCDGGFVAERIDNPDTIDVRFWGAECADTLCLYDFFGNEPLANYLYGALHLPVPGLRNYCD